MALFDLLPTFDLVLESVFPYWRLLLLASISFSVIYLYWRTARPRDVDIRLYSHFPQPEAADPKRGHWPWLEKIGGEGDPRRAFDEMLYEQCEKTGFPPVLLVDMRPVEKFLLLLIFDNEVAEQVTRPSKQFSTSMPKHPSIQTLAPLVGARSLVTTDGDEWKGLRKRILPGFQPSHLLTLVSPILDKTETFISLMTQKASSGESFLLESYTTNLVFDIIGLVTFDMDLNAQVEGQQSDVLLTYRALSQAFNKRPFGAKWWRIYFSENEREIRRLDARLDRILKEEIKRQHAALLSGKSGLASRSVATLSLHDIPVLTPPILQQTSDTLRGFLFAGHDTTSILLQWLFYELHIHPSASATLAKELTSVFGPDPHPSSVISQLRGPNAHTLLSSLPFTDALIKETLRLHPPGTTARVAPVGSNTTLTLPNGDVLGIDGMCVSPRAYVIQRHPKVFGESRDEFRPERWLGEEGKAIPENAFRPYERGPRRCTGSELANLEVRVLVACVGRWFEFVKVGLGEREVDERGEGVLDEGGKWKTRGKMFSTYLVTCKPVDGMETKVVIKGQ